MLEEAERALRCRKAEVLGVVAPGREIERGCREAKCREGESPKEDEAQESQGRRPREKSGDGVPQPAEG